MYIELFLINILAIIGSAPLTAIICSLTEKWYGFVIMVATLVFANWVWWSVYFNNFKWF